MKTSLTSVDYCVFDLNRAGLLLIVNDNIWQCCKWLFSWFVDLIWVEWKNLLCLRVYDIGWVWHSWLSIMFLAEVSWLRYIMFNYQVFLDCDWGWLWCHLVECVSLVGCMWSLLVGQMCLLLDELGQVRRVGWLSEHLMRLTQVYDWFDTGTQAA